jgi:hypothetical protein
MGNGSLLFARATFVAAVVLIAGSSIPAAHAGIIYNTTFESPVFSTGPLLGQDGWQVYGPGDPSISTFADTGSQSVFVDGDETSQSGPFHVDVATGPIVDLSADLAIFTASTQTEWQFGGLGTGSQFLGGIDVFPDDSIEAITAGFPVIGAFPRAGAFDQTAWHSVDLLFNFTSQTYSIALDGVTLASSLPFCGDNGSCAGANVPAFGAGIFDSFGAASPGVTSGSIPNDSGYMDNFQVAASPEPSTLLLLGLGLAGAAIRLRRR